MKEHFIPTTKIIRSFSVITLLCFANSIASAADKEVVPQEEKIVAKKLGMSGPTKTSGVKSVELLESVPLGDDFDSLQNYLLRLRKITILPEGIIGVHQHTKRPGVVYMLEGEMTEFRNNQDNPVVLKNGESSFEKGGVIHWWRNDSGKIAIALVADIVPSE